MQRATFSAAGRVGRPTLALLADQAKLTKILTDHVLGSTVTPAGLGTKGPFTSVEGSSVMAAGRVVRRQPQDQYEMARYPLPHRSRPPYVPRTWR